jgi:xanthine dehydrogenase molybdopterin-binding subunit B
MWQAIGMGTTAIGTIVSSVLAWHAKSEAKRAAQQSVINYDKLEAVSTLVNGKNDALVAKSETLAIENASLRHAAAGDRRKA